MQSIQAEQVTLVANIQKQRLMDAMFTLFQCRHPDLYPPSYVMIRTQQSMTLMHGLVLHRLSYVKLVIRIGIQVTAAVFLMVVIFIWFPITMDMKQVDFMDLHFVTIH